MFLRVLFLPEENSLPSCSKPKIEYAYLQCQSILIWNNGYTKETYHLSLLLEAQADEAASLR
jgi:hypothetical protein